MSNTVKIPVEPSLNIEKFSGATIVTASSMSTNIVYDRFPENILYATQRPSVNILESASAAGVGANGRGIHYWSAQKMLYIVNNDTVYINSYASGNILSISAGIERCYFVENGLYLCLIDPENNQGWVISSAGNILEMTGAGNWAAEVGTPAYDFSGFPKDLGNSLADGIATLDGTTYVLSTNAEISGSDIENLLIWGTLNVITAEKEPDAGIFIGKINDNIIVMGTKTQEFFWDAANPTGSPLSPVDNVSYNIGCNDGKSVWIESDIIYFVGASNSGEIAVYRIAGFKIEKVSTPPEDSYFTTAKMIDNVDIIGSGFSSGGRTYHIVTLYQKSTVISPKDTLVYNAQSNTWTLWEHAYSSIDQFPLVGWTISTSTDTGVSGKGIFSNGDYFNIIDDFNPQDSTNATIYVEGLLAVTGTNDISFDNAGSKITSITTDLSGFSDGDQFDVTGATDAGNNTSYIVSGVPTATSITTATPPAVTLSPDLNAVTLTRDDYWDSGYVSNTGAAGTFIPIQIRMGHLDFGTRTSKRGNTIRYIGDKTSISQIMTVKWSKENHSSFNSGRTIDLSNPKAKISRIGSFTSLTMELSGSFSEQIRVQGLEFNYSQRSK